MWTYILISSSKQLNSTSFSLWLSFVFQSNQASENLFVQLNPHTGYTQFDTGDCATYPRYFFQSISDAVDIV